MSFLKTLKLAALFFALLACCDALAVQIIQLTAAEKEKFEQAEDQLRKALNEKDFHGLQAIIEKEPLLIKTGYGSQWSLHDTKVWLLKTGGIPLLKLVWVAFPANKYAALDYLLEKGADIKNIEYKLAEAAQDADVAAVKWLMDHGLHDLRGEIAQSVKEKRKVASPSQQKALDEIIDLLQHKIEPLR